VNPDRVTAIVYGTTNFPDHPDREGAWGLVGGEDCLVKRTTFTSIGAAMTWARKVLRGDLTPRNIEWAGPLLTPNTGIYWNRAHVVVPVDDDDITFVTVNDHEWRQEDTDGRFGDVVRDDYVYFGGPGKTTHR